jgi:hypothetical protein
MTKNYLNEYLKPFINRIVVANQYDLWKQKRADYLYKGELGTKRLRNILPNEIILEFDFTEKGNDNYDQAQKHAQKWHKEAKSYLQKLNIGFHVTDHGGKSPHIRFQVYGLDILPSYVRSLYKEKFVGRLLKEIDFRSDLVLPDRGLLIKPNSLVSLEFQPHFKSKYNNAIEEITHIEHRPQLIPQPNEILTIQESFKKESKPTINIKLKDVNQDKLEEWFKSYYKEGKMNDVDLAFFGMCKRSGLSEEEARGTYQTIITKLGHELDYKRERRLVSTYESDNIAVYAYLKSDDLLDTSCQELYECFKVFDKSLISAEDIMNMDIPPIEWDIEGLVTTNGYHFLAGLAGRFKTYLGFFMARSFITGEQFLGREVKKRRVLLVDEESRERTLKERTRKVLSDLNSTQRHNFKYSISKGIKFDEKNVSQLEEDIKNSKAEVVIMDSFARFFVGNENSADDVKKSFELLKPMMEKYDCSFIIIHHFNKGDSSDMNSLRGSSDLAAQCDTILVINEDFKDNYSLWLAKNRHGEKGDKIKFRTMDLDNNTRLTINFVGEVSQVKESAEVRNAKLFYDHLIKEEYESFSLNANADKFFKQLGLSKNILYKARDVLLKEGKLLSKGKGIYEIVEDEFVEVK